MRRISIILFINKSILLLITIDFEISLNSTLLRLEGISFEIRAEDGCCRKVESSSELTKWAGLQLYLRLDP